MNTRTHYDVAIIGAGELGRQLIRQLLEEGACLGRIPARQHDGKAMSGERGHDGARRTSRTKNARYAEQVAPLKLRAQRLEKTGCIGIGAQQATVLRDQRVYGPNPLGQGIELVIAPLVDLMFGRRMRWWSCAKACWPIRP